MFSAFLLFGAFDFVWLGLFAGERISKGATGF
jgi:hypothetical protein